jgi:hypothetical protein
MHARARTHAHAQVRWYTRQAHGTHTPRAQALPRPHLSPPSWHRRTWNRWQDAGCCCACVCDILTPPPSPTADGGGIHSDAHGGSSDGDDDCDYNGSSVSCGSSGSGSCGSSGCGGSGHIPAGASTAGGRGGGATRKRPRGTDPAPQHRVAGTGEGGAAHGRRREQPTGPHEGPPNRESPFSSVYKQMLPDVETALRLMSDAEDPEQRVRTAATVWGAGVGHCSLVRVLASPHIHAHTHSHSHTHTTHTYALKPRHTRSA